MAETASGAALARAGARLRGGFAGRTLARLAWLALGGALGLQVARAATPSLAQVGPLAIDLEAFLSEARRLAPFQWQRFGATWPERRRRLLDELLVPRALLELEARRLPRAWPPARDSALAGALLAELRAEVARSAISEQELALYLDRHRRHYETPRGILLWRILVRGEGEARELIEKLKQPEEAEWRRLARERSIDSATHMRGGSLGYVSANGQSHIPQLRVSPGLFAAAERVADGALVPEPVAEGDAFAVLWRRASRPARAPSLRELAPELRSRILEQRLGAAYAELIERLRRERLSAHQPELLAGFAPEPSEAAPAAQALPAPAAPATRPVRLLPEPTARGLR